MAITRIRRARDQAQQAEPAIPYSMMNRPTMSFDDSNRENYIMRSSRGLPTLFDRAQDVAFRLFQFCHVEFCRGLSVEVRSVKVERDMLW